MKKIVVCALVTFCLTSFGHSLAAPKKSTPAAPKSSEASKSADPLTGKVMETMDSGGYTYIQIENAGGKSWFAVSQASVKKGDTVTFKPGAVMENFESKTLKRKFDKIVFSDGIASSGAKTAGAKASEPKPSGSKDKVVKPAEKIKVEKAAGADAYSVSDLYKNKAKLNEKKVTVKGKVVKVSKGIMQRDWVHIQDGTGDAKKGTNNLVTTSTSGTVPAVGDVVTVSGTGYKDKDFGSGYKYEIIVENSTYKK
ncbi:MAG: DNA-binding protein [Nitrospirae bacterium]|nr:DNA-binding protein [Nitrospirota bacterium]